VVGTGSPLEVPIPAPPAFASVPQNHFVEVNGMQYCIPLGINGCPTGDPPFLCSDPNKTPLPVANLSIRDNDTSTTHTPKWFQGTTENPSCPSGLISGNPTSCYIYIGGITYRVC